MNEIKHPNNEFQVSGVFPMEAYRTTIDGTFVMDLALKLMAEQIDAYKEEPKSEQAIPPIKKKKFNLRT